MNKKFVALIIVILISFCFLTIVVADNATNDDNNSTDHNMTIDDDKVDKNKTIDKNKTSDKNKTVDKNKTDKPKKDYILAKGKGDNIKFSDGFRGFILDYSKSPASSGDKFKRVSTSKASNSNALKLAIIESYKQDSSGQIGKIIADFVKTGSSNTKVGKAVEASHEKVGDHEVVKIDNHTEAVFDFEVLKSVSGNESDYFAYKVSFNSINDENEIIQSNNLTNITNTTNSTNTTNVTNTTLPIDNETNTTFLSGLYDYLAFLANALYDAWGSIFDTLINDFLMMVNALEDLVKMFEDLMMEIQSLIDAIGELFEMLESLWEGLAGLLKLFAILLAGLDQLLNMIGYLLSFISQLVLALISLIQQLLGLLSGLISAIISLIQQLLGLLSGLISAIISLIQQLLGLLYGLIDFILGLINQIISLLQAIFAFLKSAGSFLVNVIDNAVIIIVSFVIITFGAFIYNRIR